MRGDGGVASEGRVVGVPKFHSWGKYTMPLTNINSDWMSNASSGLCIIYIILFILYYVGPLSCILGCNYLYSSKVTTPQDAHRSLVLQVYRGSNTLEFSAIRR